MKETQDPRIQIRECPVCTREWLEWGCSSFMTCKRCRERERCAKIAEGGHFIHDAALDAQFGKVVAAAIRREA